MSINTLVSLIREKKNPTVAGLDPRLSYVPAHIREKHLVEGAEPLGAAADAIYEFNRGLIDALCDIVPAVKPQSAYFELLGAPGAALLKKTIDYARGKGMYVIVDGKRNDIGPTAEAYADAYLGTVEINGRRLAPYGADGLTVNPYLGSDGIKPFVKRCAEYHKSIFILVKTSNQSSGEFQDKLIWNLEPQSVPIICVSENGEPIVGMPVSDTPGDLPTLYEAVAAQVGTWGEEVMTPCGYSELGAVVGATYPEELESLRAQMPRTYILVPGYGAQGGGAAEAARAFNSDGLGAIVNSSRAIMCAWQKSGGDGSDFALAARHEAIRMRDELMRHI